MLYTVNKQLKSTNISSIFIPTGWGSALSLSRDFTHVCVRVTLPPQVMQGSVAVGTKEAECKQCSEEEESCAEGGGVAHTCVHT